MTGEDKNAHSSADWTGGAVGTRKGWLDRWSDRHPIALVAIALGIWAGAQASAYPHATYVDFGMAVAVAALADAVVLGSGLIGMYSFIGLMKKMAPERYEALHTSQKSYVRILFGSLLITSFAIGPILLNRVVPMIWGAP